MLDNAINDFAKRMNMPSFGLNEKGLASLQVGELCYLHFEKTQDELLFYISFAKAPYDTQAYERVLTLSHYKHNYPLRLFSGVYNDNYILLTRFLHNEVSAANLETAFQFLLNLIPKAEGK